MTVRWPIVGHEDDTRFQQLDVERQQQAVDTAVGYLWNWTGRAYGHVDVTVDVAAPPRRRGSVAWPLVGHVTSSSSPWWPAVASLNMLCGACGPTCSCAVGPEGIVLPGPVAEVVEVSVAGTTLDVGAYRLDSRRRLVRTDGGRWPCTSTDRPVTVDYVRGNDVPAGGQVAAGALAVQVGLALLGDDACALPQRIQSVTRQGVTVAVLDGFDSLYDHGSTGIWLVDSWVSSVTAARRPRARVASPDTVRRTATRPRT